jgi:hypothetical protein
MGISFPWYFFCYAMDKSMEKITPEEHNSTNNMYYHEVGIICAFKPFGVLHDFFYAK